MSGFVILCLHVLDVLASPLLHALVRRFLVVVLFDHLDARIHSLSNHLGRNADVQLPGDGACSNPVRTPGEWMYISTLDDPRDHEMAIKIEDVDEIEELQDIVGKEAYIRRLEERDE